MVRTVNAKKTRLDQILTEKGLAETRSQAGNSIRLGEISVDGRVITKPGYFVDDTVSIKRAASEQYVSRAGLKLASIAKSFKLDFKGKVVLDVGSSTGGFTDYALQHGAKRVIAVDVGTNQLHPSLHKNSKIELHEQTDIRSMNELSSTPDIVVIDVSFISLREILPHVAKLLNSNTQVIAMVKPQFEAGADTKHKGIIKNDRVRRDILQSFETWVKQYFVVLSKADSAVKGSKGNIERFYYIQKQSAI